jgi:hypothetical protein
MNRFLMIGVTAVCLVAFKTGRAADITFEFQGVVDQVFPAGCVASVGEVFSGSYTFSTTPQAGSAYGFFGAPYGYRVDFSNGTFSNYGGLEINVSGPPTVPPTESLVRVIGFTRDGRLPLEINIRTTLSDSSLPLVPFPLGSSASLGVYRLSDECTVLGHLTQLVARSPGNGLYDSLISDLIDPELWNNSPPCQRPRTLECVREPGGDGAKAKKKVKANSKQINGLQMRMRTYGETSSNQGVSNDINQLVFSVPNPITTIVSNVVVTEAGAVTCAQNPGGSHTHARIDGRFFNTGSGNEADDVTAFIVVEKFSEQPPADLDIYVFAHTAGAFFGNTPLGTITIGELVQLTIQWDHAQNRFVFTLERNNLLPSVATIPYTFSDTAPPNFPQKTLGVHTFAASCTNDASVASITAEFSNVHVNQGALP